MLTTGANNAFTGDNSFSGGFTLTSTSLTDILGLIYPVGMVITLGVSTNPATLLGIGTWTAIEGTVIVGLKSTGTFDTLDETGGAETHTLTVAEMPAHTHNSNTPNEKALNATVGSGLSSSEGGNSSGRHAITSTTGGGQHIIIYSHIFVSTSGKEQLKGVNKCQQSQQDMLSVQPN